MYGLVRELRLALLDSLAPARCAGCGRSGSALCERCVGGIDATPQPILIGVRAAFRYRDEVRSVLHHGKFRDCRAALCALAWMGASRLTPPVSATVTPVPLAGRRATACGYNQAEVVATAFADFHRLPRLRLLERTRDTPPQSTLDRPGREANVGGVFTASAQLAGATIWLIDDVLTTGATTAAAKQALTAAGAVRVEVAVLAAVL
jgi:predicted amidophosphoribosyltransferase